MTRWKFIAGAAIIVPLVAGTAAGATLQDLALGDHWMGDSWDADSLKDRTVVIEFWGLN